MPQSALIHTPHSLSLARRRHRYPIAAYAWQYEDIEMIRAHTHRVKLLDELVPRGAGYLDRLNLAQLVLTASADVTIATQGGAAVLSSYAATNVVMLCRAGFECAGDSGGGEVQSAPDVAWWSKLNNATITQSSNERALQWAALQGTCGDDGHAVQHDVRMYRGGVRVGGGAPDRRRPAPSSSSSLFTNLRQLPRSPQQHQQRQQERSAGQGQG